MDGISRKDLDTASHILETSGIDGAVGIAERIRKMDMIPKLYAYTYFKKVREIMQDLKVYDKEFDFDEFESTVENVSALSLDDIRNKREVRIVLSILNNGFQREGQFCDFDDSVYHGQTDFGMCQCESHEFDEPNQIGERLFPTYQADEDTRKIEESTEWWCKGCCDASDGWSDDFDIACDMDLED